MDYVLHSNAVALGKKGKSHASLVSLFDLRFFFSSLSSFFLVRYYYIIPRSNKTNSDHSRFIIFSISRPTLIVKKKENS